MLERRSKSESRESLARAISDIYIGLIKFDLSIYMAWLDIKQRYRRSLIGPFWLSISMAIFVISLGTLYAGIFSQNIRTFLPYVAAGFMAWQLISSSLIESTSAFTANEGLIKIGNLPISFSLFRVIYRNLIIFGHNMIIMILIYIWNNDIVNYNFIMIIPNLIIFIINIAWISLAISIFCVRFRDLAPIVGNLLQVLLFLTPIMYLRSSVPAQLSFLVDFNPMFYLVECVRAPLLGQPTELRTIATIFLLGVLGWTLTIMLYRKTRHRIAYWL